MRYNHAAKTHKWAFQKMGLSNKIVLPQWSPRSISALQRGDPVVSVLKDRSDGEGGVRISGGVAVHWERLDSGSDMGRGQGIK